MPIRIVCSCKKVLNARDKMAGKQVKCPACGATLTVPAQAPAADPAPGKPAGRPKQRAAAPAKRPVPSRASDGPPPSLKVVVIFALLDSVVLGIMSILAMNAASNLDDLVVDDVEERTYESYLKHYEDGFRETILQERGTFVARSIEVDEEGKTFLKIDWVDIHKEKRYYRSLIQSREDFEKEEASVSEFVDSVNSMVAGIWWSALVIGLLCLAKAFLALELPSMTGRAFWGVIIIAGIQVLLLTLGLLVYGMKGHMWVHAGVNAGIIVFLLIIGRKVGAQS